jgi:hypothetical protein
VGELAFVLDRRCSTLSRLADSLLEQERLVRKEDSALADQELLPSEPSTAGLLGSD